VGRVGNLLCGRATYNRIQQHIHTNNLFSPAQFVFMENKSMETAIYSLTNHILETFECNNSLGIVCDLAFDCVVDDILSKLAAYGIWFTCNGLSLNLKKTKVLKFDTSNQDNTPIH
jgi:hypothetical protein